MRVMRNQPDTRAGSDRIRLSGREVGNRSVEAPARGGTASCSGRFARPDAGQAVPLVLALVAIGAVLLLALVPLAQAAAERAQARTAADAAALAGAAEGEDAAREVAAANGAELVGWETAGTDVWVAVEVGDAHAVAKARRSQE